MRALAILLVVVCAPIFAQPVPIPGDTESSLEQGVEAFQSGKYKDAIASFQKAVDFDPNDAMAHLYLGIAHMTQYTGMQSPESTMHSQQARAEFLRAIQIAPANKTALQYLASLSMREAQVTQDPAAKTRMLDEARDWYLKVIALDGHDKDAYFSIATVDWLKLGPEVMNAPATGPIENITVRQSLKNKYGGPTEDGIANLNKALDIDPKFEPAMNYMNMFIRARAHLRDTQAEYQNDMKAADEWVQKLTALHNKVQRIRRTQPPKLLSKVDPLYPSSAKQARVQGPVRFTAIIGKDGHIMNLQLVSGPPLLVAAAQDAINQWVYEPTLVNGEPVEVVTQVMINFTLPVKDEKSRDRASTAATIRQ